MNTGGWIEAPPNFPKGEEKEKRGNIRKLTI
jgi:hypothetical protein